MLRKSLLMLLAFGLIIATFLWATSLAWQHHAMRRAVAEWVGVANDESLFSWDMSSPGQIIADAARDIDGLHIEDGILSGELGERFGFVPLNLAGRVINTRRYHRLRARVYSSADTEWLLFHEEVNGDTPIGSQRFPIRSGWQDLELDLDELGWQAERYRADGRRGTTLPSRWGGASHTAASLRLHPGDPAGTGFSIDWIRLERDPLAGADPVDALESGGIHAPHPADLLKTSDDWTLTMPQGIRTPEWSLWFRDHVRTRTPDAILFPHAPQAADLEPLPPPARLFSAPPDSTARMGNRVMTGFFALLCLFWRLGSRKRDPSARAAGDLSIATIGAAFLLVRVPDLTHPPVWAMVWAAALLGFALWAIWQSRDYGNPGNRQAWLWTTALTAVLAALLLVAGRYNGANLGPWPGQALAYLPWALVQQLLLGPFLALRWERIVRRPEPAALLAGLMFGAIHFPNFALMSGTLVLGTCWALLFLRFRTWLPLAVSHALLAPLPLLVLPVWLLRSAEVGARFWQ